MVSRRLVPKMYLFMPEMYSDIEIVYLFFLFFTRYYIKIKNIDLE